MIEKKLGLFLFFCLVAVGGIKAQDPVMLLTFQQLVDVPDNIKQQSIQGDHAGLFKEIHGQKVSIRGFVYQADDSRLVLAAEPNLKSCCIGSTVQVERQIELDGITDKASLSDRAVSLQGVFSVHPVMNDDGTWRRWYVLENAHLVESQHDNMWLWVIIGLILVGIGSYFLLKRKR